MALPILDGNQSATTLSTILSGGQHITAHTVISLGTQAITDMRGAVSGSVVSISNFPASQVISGTVTANPTGTQTIAGTVTANVGNAENIIGGGYPTLTDLFANETIAVRELPNISGTVTANAGLGFDSAVYQGMISFQDTEGGWAVESLPPISGTVTANLGSALPAGTNRIGVVTIGGGTVTIGAGTAQIGSVTASISNSLTIGSLPALVAGTAQIGSVTASISNSVVTFYPMQGTSVSNTNFTSTTASTTLVSAVANREVLTVFNESGTLFISPGATCTTVAYQVRLGSGDYWECPQGQLSLQHTGVYLTTGGTARVCQVS